jgi:hypothetical protein
MKIFFAFVLWAIITMILALSVIGWVVLLPQVNDGQYYQPPEKLRSTWMRMGYGLIQKLLGE